MRATKKTISWRNVDILGSAGQGKTSRSHAFLVGTVLMLALTAASGWGAEVPPPCPSSPNYTDFSANGNCLTLNGTANLLVSPVLQITSAQAGQAGVRLVHHATGCPKRVHHDFPVPVHKRLESSGRRNRLRHSEFQHLSNTASQEAAAPWRTATPIRASIRAQGLGFPKAWQSNSTLTKTVGIPRLKRVSVTWQFRAASRGPIRHTMASYAGETQVRIRLWASRSWSPTWRTARCTMSPSPTCLRVPRARPQRLPTFKSFWMASACILTVSTST